MRVDQAREDDPVGRDDRRVGGRGIARARRRDARDRVAHDQHLALERRRRASRRSRREQHAIRPADPERRAARWQPARGGTSVPRSGRRRFGAASSGIRAGFGRSHRSTSRPATIRSGVGLSGSGAGQPPAPHGLAAPCVHAIAVADQGAEIGRRPKHWPAAVEAVGPPTPTSAGVRRRCRRFSARRAGGTRRRHRVDERELHRDVLARRDQAARGAPAGRGAGGRAVRVVDVRVGDRARRAAAGAVVDEPAARGITGQIDGRRAGVRQLDPAARPGHALADDDRGPSGAPRIGPRRVVVAEAKGDLVRGMTLPSRETTYTSASYAAGRIPPPDRSPDALARHDGTTLGSPRSAC